MNDFRTYYPDDPETLAFLRGLLRTADGMPAPYLDARIRGGRVSSTPSGHALSSHVASSGRLLDELRGGGRSKSRFRRLDDAVEALRQLLNSPDGRRALKLVRERPDKPQPIRADVTPAFDVECSTRDRGRRAFTASQLTTVGRREISCFALIAVRTRPGREYLHVQTLYPEIPDVALAALVFRFPGPSTA